MRKIIPILIAFLLFISVQPVAVSESFLGLDEYDTCGVLSIIIIIFVIVAGLYITITDSRNRKAGKIDNQQKPSKYCTNCGREIPFDALLCPYCGTKF